VNLAGRRILFVGIGFYDYEGAIADRLRALGAEVRAVAEHHPALRRPWVAGLARRLPALRDALQRRHERRLLEDASRGAFDQVLVIKGIGLGVEFLRELRRRLPRAELVLYEWDSLARLPGIEERLPLFDRVLTFDRVDAASRPGLRFRPLFYREGADPGRGPAPDLDVSFVGWLHSDRLAGVRAMEEAARADGLSTFVYLYTGLATWLRLALRGQARGVHWRPIRYREVTAIHLRSRCVLDLPHPAQTGLTMRAIEAVGLGCKLATTSRDVVHYDFYDPASVSVLEPERPRVAPAFLAAPRHPLPPAVREWYSLDAWLRDVILGDGAPAVRPAARP
jgi:hypothetical protein